MERPPWAALAFADAIRPADTRRPDLTGRLAQHGVRSSGGQEPQWPAAAPGRHLAIRQL